MEENFNFDVSKMGDKKELIVWQGQMPEQPSQLPTPLEIDGNIYAPMEFWKIRKGLFDPDQCIVKYSSSNSTKAPYILLVCNDTSPYPQKIKGVLKPNPELILLGINNFNKSYDRLDLMKTLKMFRYLFADKEEHSRVIKNLRTFKAKFEKIIEVADDQKGNKKDFVERTLSNEFDLSFALKAKLFPGTDPVIFTVQVIIDYTASEEVTFMLESFELMDLQVENIERIFDDILDDFRGIVPVIEDEK